VRDDTGNIAPIATFALGVEQAQIDDGRRGKSVGKLIVYCVDYIAHLLRLTTNIGAVAESLSLARSPKPRTLLVWAVRVTISTRISRQDLLKQPMLVTSLPCHIGSETAEHRDGR
jgi:hypothetical protein